MEFNQRELEYLLTCLNFHYAESDYKEHIMDINSQIAIKIDEQLQLHRSGLDVLPGRSEFQKRVESNPCWRRACASLPLQKDLPRPDERLQSKMV